MTESLRDFFVSYAFQVDTTSMARAESETKAAEDRITAANAASLAKRVAQERTAQTERIAAAVAAGKDLSAEDRRFVAEQEKNRIAAAEAAHKREVEGSKKTSALRDEQFKQASQGFLRLSGVAQAFSAGLSGALGAMPFGGMVLGVQRTAAGLSDLAVQAQRVGASAAHIERFIYGMRSAGLSEGQANGALEGFAKTIKSNEPGFRSALAGMGIKTTDKDGNPLDIEQLAEVFGQKLRGMDYTTAQKYAQSYGVGDPDALNAFRNGQFAEGVGGYDKRAKTFGFDADKASEDARKVSKAWLDAETDFKMVSTKLQTEFFLPMLQGFDGLAKRMEENPQAVENIGHALEALSVVVAARTIPSLVMLAARLSGINMLVSSSPILLRLLGLGSAAGGAAAVTIAAGAAAAGEMKAPMVDDYGRVTGNWGGDPDHPFHQGEEGGPSEGNAGRPTITFGTMWDWVKGKLGFGDDQKVKADIASTAENVKKLADNAIGVGTGISAGGGGVGGSGIHADGGSGFGARLGDRSGRGGAAAMNASRTVAEGLIPEARALLDTISSGEAHAYNIMNGGATFSGYGQHPQPFKGGRAAGRYQFLGSTWLGIQRETGLKDFSPESQDKGAWYLARRDYRLRTGRDLQADLASKDPARIAAIGRALAPTWVSLNGSFAGKYGNYFSRDSAHPSASPVAAASAPSAAAPSAAAVGDAAVFAARQRILNGSHDPKDRAIVDTYLKGQNSPPKHGAPIPSWQSRDGTADGITTVDMRDPRFAPHPDDDRASRAGAPVKVEVTKPVPGLEHLKGMQGILKDLHHEGFKLPKLEGRALVASYLSNSVRHGDVHNERHGDTFHVHGRDAKAGLDAAEKLSAHRQYAERIRYGQRSQA